MKSNSGLLFGLVFGAIFAWACTDGGPGDLIADAGAQSSGSECANWEVRVFELEDLNQQTFNVDANNELWAEHIATVPAGWEPFGAGSTTKIVLRRCVD